MSTGTAAQLDDEIDLERGISVSKLKTEGTGAQGIGLERGWYKMVGGRVPGEIGSKAVHS